MATSKRSVYLGRKIKQSTGEKQTKDGNAQNSPGIDAANDFMKVRFFPLLMLKNHGIERRVERDLKRSITIVAEKFGVEALNTGNMDFPYNIVAGHWDLQEKLRYINANLDLLMYEDCNSNISSCATYERVDTNQTLYFIPLVPIYMMLKKRRTRQCGNLILKICAYLFQSIGIPLYNRDCYIQFCYESIGQYCHCLDEEGQEMEFLKMHGEIRQAQIVGEIMARKMASPYFLKNDDAAAPKFTAKNRYERKALELFNEIWQIWKKYPNNSIFQNFSQIDDYDDVGPPDAYISFVAKTKGPLWEELANSINEELNNYSGVLEPEILYLFDKPVKEKIPSLDFERKILSLMVKLAQLINEIQEWKI